MEISISTWVDPVEAFVSFTENERMWSWAVAHATTVQGIDEATIVSGMVEGNQTDAVLSAISYLLSVAPGIPVDLYSEDLRLIEAVEGIRAKLPHIEPHPVNRAACHRLRHLANQAARSQVLNLTNSSDILQVAVDGSWGAHTRFAGWAMLTSDGRWDSNSGAKVASPLIAEVTAVCLALRRNKDASRIHILSDSQNTLELLDGKSAHGGTGTLLAQAKRLIEGREVTWEWVPAHAGHALNEGADRLALAARRAGENKTDRQLLRTISTDIAKEMSKAHREGRSVEPTMRPVARTNKV